MESIYDYTLDYYGNYVNDVLGTNNVITINYYRDLFAKDTNNEYIIPDTVLTGYKNGNEFAFKVTLPDEIKKEIFSEADYEKNKNKEITVPIKIIRVLFDSKYPLTDPNGIDKPAGLYQYICVDFDDDGDLLRNPNYFILVDADLPVFPEGYTAPAQMGLIETGEDIGNKTMKQLFIAALGKDGWQDMPKFSYSAIKYLDSANANIGKDFDSSYQIGTTLNIYGLTINYKADDGKYLSTSEGTFIVPVIGSTSDGTYTANTLSSGKGKTYSITPTNGTKSGTIKLTFSSQETYSFTKIGAQTIVSSITGNQSYTDPSNSNKVEFTITGTNKYINVGQHPVYYAYLTEDPSANSTIPTNSVDKIQKTLQTSKLSDNIEFTVPDKTITKASYLYIFVSTLISEETCTLSILNPEKTSAAKLDKLAGLVKISTGSTGDDYNKFYAFRVSNQTYGNAYSNWYIKYNKK